jgi:hypothetical protein
MFGVRQLNMANLVIFKSDPKQTHFAPEWEYVMSEETIDTVDFNIIRDYILQKEPEILSTVPTVNKDNVDGYTSLGSDSLTSRYNGFNVFSWDHPEIQKLKYTVHKQYLSFLQQVNVPRRKVYVQCWANVMRKGQQITPHLHSVSPFTYLSGHVTVACEDTSTVYICPINQINEPLEYKSPNHVGNLTFFQSNIPHYTTKHMGDKERITIAFDLKVSENYNAEIHKNFIEFDDPNSSAHLISQFLGSGSMA